jgi:hypothetical protein
MAGTHSSPIAWMTAVKDRIRWLSRINSEALAGYAARDARIAALEDGLHTAHNRVARYADEREQLRAELAALRAAQAPAVVMPEREGGHAQKSFWAGFEVARMRPEESNIRAAWNEFKASEQFARLNAVPASPSAKEGE